MVTNRATIAGVALLAFALLGGVALWGGVALSQTAPAPTAKADDKSADPAAIASVAATKARAAKADHQRGAWDPIHFKPAIDFSKNEACLVCHSEINKETPRATSSAGVEASKVEAWYQTLETYAGNQQTFHWRHLQSPFSKQVMNLQCNFCHQGNDPREKSPHVTATDAKGQNMTAWRNGAPAFTLRKTVNPTETCLRCHGNFPAEQMGLPGPWTELRESLESAEAPNGCLTCHAEQFRTNRHHVNYLKADGIEKLAKNNSDVCYGCHGGRQWYRISYPYPRHPWPGMADTPDWAKDRPTESDPQFRLPQK
jgi:hypothetical protein